MQYLRRLSVWRCYHLLESNTWSEITESIQSRRREGQDFNVLLPGLIPLYTNDQDMVFA